MQNLTFSEINANKNVDSADKVDEIIKCNFL